MGQNSKIEWTDHTFNPWRSCQHLILADGSTHPACEHCYAEAMAKRFPDKLGEWGPEGTRIMAPVKYWEQPVRWNKAAEKAGQRARVFCASIADVFEDWQGPIHDGDGNRLAISATGCIGPRKEKDYGPSSSWLEMDDLRAKLFCLIDDTPWLDWQLLTKRPGNIIEMWFPEPLRGGCEPKKNVWLGTSISNQQTADELIPQLLQARDLAPVLFLSAEPLLGSMNLKNVTVNGGDSCDALRGETCSGKTGCLVQENGPSIDWLICGGESGQQARPMHPDWARSLRDQCQAAGVPFFFKQWGEWLPEDHVGGVPASFDWGPINRNPVQGSKENPQRHYHWWNDSFPSLRVGKKAAGRLLDGREWNEFPAGAHTEAPRHREEEPV